MRTSICSSGVDCVLIILSQLYGSMAGFFKSNLFWVGQYDHLPIFKLEEELEEPI